MTKDRAKDLLDLINAALELARLDEDASGIEAKLEDAQAAAQAEVNARTPRHGIVGSF